MVQINFAQKQVNAKIVYYGPGMSGKTTNLEIIHQRAPKANRGELTSISTDGDRTLFFDFMPLDLGTVAGMRTCFQIYTVPGQVYYNSTRKLVLQGVDGVIFVADSSASMMEENLESLRNLEQNLAEYGRSLDDVALVIQYNKRDLPDALPVEALEAKLNPKGVPNFEGIAHTGQGVFPTLKALAARVIENIHNQQRAALSPAGGASNRRPTRAVPEAAAQATHVAQAAADAPPAPLPTRAEPQPVTASAPAPPTGKAKETRLAAPRPASISGLRMAEPAHAPEARPASASGSPPSAGPQPAAPARGRRPAMPEAAPAPAKRTAAAAQAAPGRNAGSNASSTKAPAQPSGKQAKAQGRRGAQQTQNPRRTPRPTPGPQKTRRNSVLTAVIVIASVGIGAVLGSLVLGAL